MYLGYHYVLLWDIIFVKCNTKINTSQQWFTKLDVNMNLYLYTMLIVMLRYLCACDIKKIKRKTLNVKM